MNITSHPGKRAGIKPAHTIIIMALALFFFTPPAFAKTQTPYNALARRLPSNTTKGVFNETDKLQPNTQVSGTIGGKNGSTFLIRLPKDDAGYNVLFSKETTITLNGKKATSKNIVKGLAVTVTGTLDISTYTLKADLIELGKTNPEATKPVVVEKTISSESAKLPSDTPPDKPVKTAPPVSKSASAITRTLKQGSRGAEVTLLQNKLIELGLLSADSATGYFGPQTTKAVKAFQKKHKLPQVGSVGAQTRKLLN